MRTKLAQFCVGVIVLCLGAAIGHAAEVSGLKSGTVELKSAGPLAFGPQGVLLVGDPKAAAVYAIDTRDTEKNAQEAKFNDAQLTKTLSGLLGVAAEQVEVNDLAVNPLSGNIYLSVTQGGEASGPVLVKLEPGGKASKVSLTDVKFSKAVLPDAPEDKEVGEGRRRGNPRLESITDLAFVQGQVIVSGVAEGAAPSSVRVLSFPFSEADPGARLEIFHAAHGRFEDYATVRTFVPFNIGGEPSLLAAFTCTPLVRVPVDELAKKDKIRGTTVAELGNRNRPLDMIVYEKDGKEFLLLSNSARGVMKISTDDIGRKEGITDPVRGGGTAGQKYDTIAELEGVVQLDKLNDTSAVVLIAKDGGVELKTIELP